MISGYYTGIGGRDTPLEVRQLMTEVAMHLRHWGFTLRTGTSSAADKAFEVGAGDLKEIYVPWKGWNEKTGITSLSVASSRLAHYVWLQRQSFGTAVENWGNVHPGTQALLAKSMCMVMGQHITVPSDALICWTPNAQIVGISAHPITLATIVNIPVFNLAEPETEDVIKEMLREDRHPMITFENRRERCKKGQETYGII
jgi:hypothetical protein